MAKQDSSFAPRKLNVNQNALAQTPDRKEPGIVSEILEPSQKANKGGRPKGIPKTKKTFYLATDMGLFDRVKLNLARNAGIIPKDESDTVDLALELLAAVAVDTEYTALINKVNKNRLKP
jgi:hypothetical protein